MLGVGTGIAQIDAVQYSSARAETVSGSRKRPLRSARWSKIALLSKMVTAPSTMAGVLPLGLIAR